jgi:hypothetical protein
LEKRKTEGTSGVVIRRYTVCVNSESPRRQADGRDVMIAFLKLPKKLVKMELLKIGQGWVGVVTEWWSTCLACTRLRAPSSVLIHRERRRERERERERERALRPIIK